jgi:chemotaxis protein methyltransferase CheR
MDTQDFQLLAELLKMRSGLMVTPAQTGLMESRLLPVAHLHGLHSISQLCAVLRIAPTYTLRMDVCEAMATGETSFFRDITPYAYFCGTVLPLLMQNNAAQTLRIWSAACATGQEPYTIAMCIEEERTALAGREVEILASLKRSAAFQFNCWSNILHRCPTRHGRLANDCVAACSACSRICWIRITRWACSIVSSAAMC